MSPTSGGSERNTFRLSCWDGDNLPDIGSTPRMLSLISRIISALLWVSCCLRLRASLAQAARLSRAVLPLETARA